MTTESATAPSAPESQLGQVAAGQTPVLESLVAMNLDSLENSGLDPSTYVLVRLAALVAMDGAPVSYLIHLGMAGDAGVTLEQAQGVLVALAPMVGSARIASAAGKILRAYGLSTVLDDTD
jgi:4-carboxymuconolactone decarboxylase